MSKIKNEPKHKMALIQQIRGQLEQRAIWLALLTREAAEKGLDPMEFGDSSIWKTGCMQGATLNEGTKNLKMLKKNLFTPGARLIFEMDLVESTEDRLSLDFHYCPLVKGWQKLGCSDEEISRLCDVAMMGDRGIGRQFGAHLNLAKTIARGDDICELRYVSDRVEEDTTMVKDLETATERVHE